MDVSITSSPLTTTPNTRVVASSDTSQNKELAQQQQQQIQQLKARDRVVRAHEAAHLAAGSGIVRGGAQFTFQRGPDGVQYAIGGEVKIDASEVAGDPEATLQKAEQIRAAALAPAQPSMQDRNIAAKAAQMAIEARAEINQNQNDDDIPEGNTSVFTKTTSAHSGSVLDLTI